MDSENTEAVQVIVGEGTDNRILIKGKTATLSKFSFNTVLVFWLRDGHLYIDEDQLEGLNLTNHETHKIEESEKRFKIFCDDLVKKWTGVSTGVTLVSREDLSKISNLVKTKGERVASPIRGILKIESSLLDEYGVWSP